MMIGDVRDAAQGAWSDFWAQEADEQSIHGSTAFQAVGGQRQAALFQTFWRTALLTCGRAGETVRMLDAACGSGVVSRVAMALAKEAPGWSPELHCTDYSAPAVSATMTALRPAMTGATAADARRLPYRDASFDVVVSQFGLEYAGLEGFREAARLVRPGGAFHAVIHHKGGAIYQECVGDEAVLNAMERCGLFRLHERVFVIGTRVDERKAAPAALARVIAAAQEARMAMGTHLTAARAGAAKRHAERALTDLERLSGRRAHYAPAEALAWMRAQAAALGAYRTRIQAMQAAGLDEASVTAIADMMTQAGFSEPRIGTLAMGADAPPAAWTFSATAA